MGSSVNHSLTASRTDIASNRLLKRLLAEGVGLVQAVGLTAEIYPDPSSGPELRVLAAREGQVTDASLGEH